MKKIILALLCCAACLPSRADGGTNLKPYLYEYVNSCHYYDGDRHGTTVSGTFIDGSLKNTTVGYAFDFDNDVCYLMDEKGVYNPYVAYKFSKSEDGYSYYDLSTLMMMGMPDGVPLFLSVNADFSVLTLTGDHGESDQYDRTDFYSRIACSVTPRSIEDAEKEEDTTVYEVVEIMPEFQGGDLTTFYKWVRANLREPGNGIRARVLVEFIVEKDGTLSNFDIVRSPDQALSDEALRVVKQSPKWTPGKKGYPDHLPVRVKLTLPVSFSGQN